MYQLHRSWVRSQHPSAQWNLRGGRWSSAEYCTNKKREKNPPKNNKIKFSLLRKKTFPLLLDHKSGTITKKFIFAYLFSYSAKFRMFYTNLETLPDSRADTFWLQVYQHLISESLFHGLKIGSPLLNICLGNSYTQLSQLYNRDISVKNVRHLSLGDLWF